MNNFDQDNINKITDYIISDSELKVLVATEDWKGLFENLNDAKIASFSFLYQYFMKLDNVNILEYIHKIGEDLFAGSDIKSLVIPDSIKIIERDAFSRCYNLESISVSNKVNVIGDRAFYSCLSLTSITIPENTYLRKISEKAFYNCISLNSVTIPSSIKAIGYESFDNCTDLTEINYLGTKNQWDTIQKGYAWDARTGEYIIHCIDGDIKKNI